MENIGLEIYYVCMYGILKCHLSIFSYAIISTSCICDIKSKLNFAKEI